MTFEELVKQCLASGKDWKRDELTGQLKCADGRCMFGALLKDRLGPVTLIDEDGKTSQGPAPFPAISEVEEILHDLDHDLVIRVVAANDAEAEYAFDAGLDEEGYFADVSTVDHLVAEFLRAGA